MRKTVSVAFLAHCQRRSYLCRDLEKSCYDLGALKTQFDALNESIPDLSQTLADAIGDRQTAYDDETGLHFVFKGVKAAVKGQYGQASQEYTQVKGIKW